MTAIRAVAAAALAASVAVATTLPDGGVPTPASHDGYTLIAADLHVHAFLGDGALPPWDVAREARRRGLDAAAITNHNQMLAVRLHRALFRQPRHALVLAAEELTAPQFHLIAIGVREPVDWRLPLADAIRAVHAQGGVAIGAHPTTTYWRRVDPAVVAMLDGLEVAHPALSESAVSRAAADEIYQRARAINPSIAPIGSSDFHFGAPIGAWRTYLLVSETTERGVLDAIRAARTVAADAAGALYGEPRWRNAVADARRAQESGGAVDSGWHHGAMALAWLSLVVLIVAGGQPPSTR